MQLWLNTLLAQSCDARHEEGWDTGQVLMLACGADRAAVDATAATRVELRERRWLGWVSYESLIEVASRFPETQGWAARFHRRYLDFAAVEHLLDEDDPRRSGPTSVTGDRERIASFVAAYDDLNLKALRVLGDESILGQIVTEDMTRLDTTGMATLTLRLAEVAEELRSLREEAAEAWTQSDVT